MKTALIDGDSIIYILAWTNKDIFEELALRAAVDEMVKGILLSTESTKYIGALGHKEHKSFRYDLAKYKPYKATRGEKPEHVILMEPIIIDQLVNQWGFITVPHLEADDIVSIAAEANRRSDSFPSVICSPDKDLKQISGEHFDYKKGEFATVDVNQAQYLFALQMLMGDTTDNVAGLPGIGPKKAEAALLEADNVNKFYIQVAREMYHKYFGYYYGNIIFEENLKVLGLLTPASNWYPDIQKITDTIMSAVKQRPGLSYNTIFNQS